MILDWPDCRNVRDVGGLPAAGARAIRAGALLRSDGHHRLTAAAVRAVRASGVSRIIDLRWARECEEFPSPFAGDPVYRHVPMLNDVLDYDIPPDTYRPMLDHNRPRVAEAFLAVAQAPPGGVVVHCAAGKDRTGVLVALLLAVAGVAAADIAEDYALTDGCSPAPMLNTLDHLDRRYGGADGYLAEAGVGAGHGTRCAPGCCADPRLPVCCPLSGGPPSAAGAQTAGPRNAASATVPPAGSRPAMPRTRRDARGRAGSSPPARRPRRCAAG
ncbi:hypothetical protein GCM10023322_46420 [Rugosimonospora acidiphila]|uniref:Tyrosine specific protein phosphatases domain-containing protein n=1 Tax=Rugosimonospora acidiphila TaxID=556531 RepID=A0ABP9S5L1_9ACTN